ncbi:conserved hypothetical protein [Talaromyces stipitatus ATCC 10500]|uniref:SRP9 domain-containing protein n=1 Tax=Talaromyces stipitatus (strain ATCC 10500 / CBS 375.48 / QM 6759 / NRRL 1006) TaxID=441959 RepID=B8M331_TALSN|nr:uncharacterized protein TSTA_092500 [Talaromyces stipitatus ATCC 10500]EED22007.1 conserved hypothetical protein [Talaromyces stipitatus ATCC 10500]
MPYLPTPNAFLEQSSLLLEAYPDDTRITTKYSYPNPSNKNNTHKISKRQSSKTTPNTEESIIPKSTTTTCATLTLKTYNPVTGICLKYKTNKAAEVGRLISGLGKLGAGVKITSATEEPVATTAAAATEGESSEVPVQIQAAPAVAAPSSGGGGGGGKKKKGKGKK